MSKTWKSCKLQIPGGKYVKVSKLKDGPQLCAIDLQDQERVKICERTVAQRHQQAFHFESNNKSYLLMVDNNKLKLQQITGDIDSEKLTDSHWFVKVNDGSTLYGLGPVSEPSRFLYVFPGDKAFCLSHHKILFRLTES